MTDAELATSIKLLAASIKLKAIRKVLDREPECDVHDDDEPYKITAMSDYTPTTEVIRNTYVYDEVAEYHDPVHYNAPERRREFERWIAQHDKKVAARTLREYADLLGVNADEYNDGNDWWAGYRQAQREAILNINRYIENLVEGSATA